MNQIEYYLDEIVKYTFLMKQDFERIKRERAELSEHLRKINSQWSIVSSENAVETERTKTTPPAPKLLLTVEDSEETLSEKKSVFYEPLKFTEKEISKMPKTFRKEFRVDGCTAHIRKRCDGRYKCSYEIRYRRNGYNVSVSASTLEEAKEKFIKKLQTAEPTNSAKKKVPITFNEFAYFWFENFHKRKVAERTYKTNIQRFRSALAFRFENTKLKDVNAKELQDIIDAYVEKGQGKSAEDVFSLLNQIFKYAVKFNLIAHNPMEMIFHTKHARKHGKALTHDEEQLLLSESAGTPYQLMFAVALYTGMRPNEYYHAQIQGNFIVTINSKRKNGEKAYKRIPIIAMLKPYLEGVETLTWYVPNRIREKFKQILPNHILYDLRTTFYTHCVVCGVAESARDEMVGHSGGVLKDTYTDLPDDFLLSEAKKLVW